MNWPFAVRVSHRLVTLDGPGQIGSLTRTQYEVFWKGILSMRPTAIVLNAIKAWEEKDANALASYLSEDLICKLILPQAVGKAQLLSYMNALTTAYPDWSFNGHVVESQYVVSGASLQSLINSYLHAYW
jgi:hypothetical protein